MPTSTLRPLPLIPALFYFGIPAAVGYVSVWKVLPMMDRAGASPLLQFVVFGSALILILIAAFVAYGLEGNPWTWADLRDRMRLRMPTRNGWAWAIGLALANVGLYIGASIAVAAVFPHVRPPLAVAKLLGDDEHFLGSPLHHAWPLFGAWVLFYLVNVFGEELWWRGIILPRQELAHGKNAWIFHGVLWAGFHISVFPTDFFVLLPGALAYGWVCQRQRSTIPGLVAHAVLNGLAGIHILTGILH
ncbi:MAG: CPBP family intramembrane metalloprotease [Xanthomonadaceae bacterium]|nr:CPBP family intramembrane metalloprotease [Xanthomonadaceae bacterium]MDE2084243.1 CPBP family intramembrane metalloprotease [Xanthomonadaceae bacterium]MDE2256880.1 CPBP family intramembrane metalloprotease [Xanthomonadaceae bacterium]